MCVVRCVRGTSGLQRPGLVSVFALHLSIVGTGVTPVRVFWPPSSPLSLLVVHLAHRSVFYGLLAGAGVDDASLWRMLAVNGWDLKAAQAQLAETVKWREANAVHTFAEKTHPKVSHWASDHPRILRQWIPPSIFHPTFMRR